jgi:hypothetical protein
MVTRGKNLPAELGSGKFTGFLRIDGRCKLAERATSVRTEVLRRVRSIDDAKTTIFLL